MTFRHVPTDMNPADILSRGIEPALLQDNRLWFDGPEFLFDESTWPPNVEVEEKAQENRQNIMHSAALMMTTSKSEAPPPFIDFARFSFWEKAIRVMINVMNFACRDKSPKQPFTAKNFNDAKMMLFKIIQRENPPNESEIAQKELKADQDGVLRCTSDRFANATNNEHLIYLPKNTTATKLVILQAHLRLLHSGVQQTLSELRSRFWIPRGRQQVKKAIKNCFPCRRLDAKPFKLPNMADFPKERLVPPFNIAESTTQVRLISRRMSINKKSGSQFLRAKPPG